MSTLVLPGNREDSLVCGSCHRNFPFGNFTNFVQHKQFDCSDLVTGVMEALVCQSCPQRFVTAWSLLRHAQSVHALKIYAERTTRNSSRQQKSLPQSANQEKNTIILPASEQETSKFSGKVEPVQEDSEIPEGFSTTPLSFTTDDQRQTSSATQPHPHQIQAAVMPDDVTVSDMTRNFQVNSASDSQDARPKTNSVRGHIDSGQNGGDNPSAELSSVAPFPARTAEGTIKKCCRSVVPKKRKRHIETKHMFGASSTGSSKGSRRRIGSPDGPTNIYIDLEPQEGYLTDFQDGECEGRISFGGDSENSESGEPDRGHKDGRDEGGYSSSYKQRSVIIQPGMTFSIPVSYALNSAPSVSIYNSKLPSSLVFSMPSTDRNPDTVFQEEKKDEHKSWGEKKFGRPEASQTTETVEKDSCQENCLTERPYSVRCDDPEGRRQSDIFVFTGVQGVQEMEASACSANAASDGQGQKKRRYPTSRPFKCDKCEDSFNQRIHLQKHQSKHTGVKPFKCDRCDYSTVERSHLKVHIRVHTGEKPYKCTYCGYATAQNSTLKIHLKRHHSASEKLVCSTCGLHFQHQDSFVNHAVREHSQASSTDGMETGFYEAANQSQGDKNASSKTPD